MSDPEPLLTSPRGDGVVELTLNRPDQRNALSQALRRALTDTLAALAADDAVTAVVLTGSGDAFCAGFDLKELAAGDAGHIFADARAYHRALHTFPKALIAAVNGPALAGGMDLAALCDVRLALRGAEFGQPQVRHGIPAAYDLLRSLLPEPTARLLCLSGRRLPAAELTACGFVAALHDDRAGLLEAARALAAECARGGAMKRAFVAAQPHLFED